MKISNSEALSFFYKNGFLVLNNYLSLFDTDAVLDSIDNLAIDALVKLESQWQNRKICFFSTSKGQNKSHANDFVKDSYFLASRDASHIFFEQIDDQYQINRIGHALHKEDYYPSLKAVINNRMIELLQQLGYQRPVCHLSVYIPKHGNGIGSFVRPHQENTFAYTEPQSALVLWIALEDAEVTNACMWGIPGSHRWPLKYISQVDRGKAQRIFKLRHDFHIPNFDRDREHYLPLEVKKGDALIMHGNFVHASPRNMSQRSRKCLSLQFIETANIYYPDFNWVWPRRSDFLYDLTQVNEKRV